jgi:hypothetical protein
LISFHGKFKKSMGCIAVFFEKYIVQQGAIIGISQVARLRHAVEIGIAAGAGNDERYLLSIVIYFVNAVLFVYSPEKHGRRINAGLLKCLVKDALHVQTGTVVDIGRIGRMVKAND